MCKPVFDIAANRPPQLTPCVELMPRPDQSDAQAAIARFLGEARKWTRESVA